MPAPEHLHPILAVLGDGGSVNMAERVHGLVEQACANAVPPYVALLVADRDRLRDELDSACHLVARMHAAAVGEVRGPIRGVVEDVQDVRTCWLAAEQRIKDLESIPGVRDAYRAWLDIHGAEHAPTIHDLIEASSLGTPEAKSARASIPLEVAEEVVRRAMASPPEPLPDDIDWGDDPATVTTGNLLLTREAEASVALDHDPEGSTYALPETPTERPEPTNAVIRAWCHAQTPPVPVSARGAVQRSAREAYTAAHAEG